jgi:hypothetical protein
MFFFLSEREGVNASAGEEKHAVLYPIFLEDKYSLMHGGAAQVSTSGQFNCTIR